MSDFQSIDEPSVKRRPGRPRGTTRSAAQSERSGARTLARGQYLGRNGEVLTRSVQPEGDQFAVPPHLKEKGWDYQWLTEHVLNNPEIVRRHNHTMYQAGWRPVMAVGKWNGVFGPTSDTGHIRVGDSGLYERPVEMSKDARSDEVRRAKRQMSDRDESLMGRRANLAGSLPSGFDMDSRRYRGAGARTRMEVGPESVPSPNYDIAGPGE